MPIRIPDKLPARKILEEEGVDVMGEGRAKRQDIRPLRIVLLNLMPDKIKTETQIARLLGATPLQIEMTLMRIPHHKSKNTDKEHLLSFYTTLGQIKNKKFDGLIITGAPIELMEFQEVTYWKHLIEIFEWSKTNIHSCFFICWGAMAAINYFHNVPKYTLDKKAFGVFRHKNLNPASPYLSGFSDDFAIPVSRWTEMKKEDIQKNKNLELLMESNETGPCLVAEKKGNRLYIFNHIEYDSQTLKDEYIRDKEKNSDFAVPVDYFPENDDDQEPLNRWRSHAHLLFGNWINQIYQNTPYKLKEIGEKTNG